MCHLLPKIGGLKITHTTVLSTSINTSDYIDFGSLFRGSGTVCQTCIHNRHLSFG